MIEGPISESGYFFPGEKIQQYLDTLKDSEYFENIPVTIESSKKIVIMTHDDTFDSSFHEYEESHGFESTWFIDMSIEDPELVNNTDIQLHFNKEFLLPLDEQIKKFSQKFRKNPKFNRNHRLLWKSNNFDFPLLAMHGITVDTTHIGTKPFIPVINGKTVPIMELPFCISDLPQRPMALYNIAKQIEIPFRNGLPIITVLAHPLKICQQYQMKSCFNDVVTMAEKYGYDVLSISQFFKEDLLCEFL